MSKIGIVSIKISEEKWKSYTAGENDIIEFSIDSAIKKVIIKYTSGENIVFVGLPYFYSFYE